jgi:class 3 adenylate cyclase
MNASEVVSSAEKFLGQDEPLLAYDVVSEGLTKWPDHVRLRQLQGLALARSGATQRANAVLEKLRVEGRADEETLGMLASTFKDLAVRAAIASDREQFLRRAAETYMQAHRATGGYWTGINAATMNLLIGEPDGATAIAREVREQCSKRVTDKGRDSYWELAALGEAALICRDLSQAGEWYARAAEQGRNRYGHLNSSRRNARLILKHWNEDESWIDKYLCVPSVILFAGHMVDRPDRSEPRFPADLESAVAKAIRDRIEDLKPGFGFSSAACGSDILFLEAMLERGAEVSIVLPYNREEFVRDSVDFVPNSNWLDRFGRVVERANHVIIASPQKLVLGGVSYEFGKQMLLGMASIRARQLDTKLIPLVVWDGMPGDGVGGAASAVVDWRSAGYEPVIIDSSKIAKARHSDHADKPVQAIYDHPHVAGHTPVLQEFRSRIVAILFADVVDSAKLTEAEVPRFVQHFLGAIAKLCERFKDSILTRNTWGDGIYLVFSDVDLAGQFALDLADVIAKTNWEEKGLPREISLRIGLHAGPAYEFDDPVTGSRTYSGTHVSRAARIEPITPRGQVYASEAFAALAAARGTKNFACDYVGQTPMAKGYGTLPTYHVRPRDSAAQL